mgnify:CR=1 FL=1
MKQFGRTLPKDQQDLIDLAISQDWTYNKTSAGHHRLVSPRGHIVIGSGSTGDRNSVWDFRARLKKAGLKPPKRKLKPEKEKQSVTTDTTVTAPAPQKEIRRRKTNPEVRARMKDTLIEALRKLDKPEGVHISDIANYVKYKLGDAAIHTTGSSLTWYSDEKNGAIFHRVARARWRLTEKYRLVEPVTAVAAPTPEPLPSIITPVEERPAPTPEDDDKLLQDAMDSIVDALSTIDGVIRRTKGTRKKLLEILGAIK